MNDAVLCLFWDLGLGFGEKSNDSKDALEITGGKNTSGGLAQGDGEPPFKKKKKKRPGIGKTDGRLFYLLLCSVCPAQYLTFDRCSTNAPLKGI